MSILANKAVLYIIAAIVALGIAGAGLGTWQRSHLRDIGALQQQVKDAKEAEQKATKKAQDEAAQGQEWKTTATAALARVGALEGRLKAIETKLAALAPQAPATKVEGLPTDAKSLAEKYTAAGVKAEAMPPTSTGLEVGMSTKAAQVGLALITDGKNYPEALVRIGLLEEDVEVLAQQRLELKSVVDAKTKEADHNLAAYQEQMEATAAAIKAADGNKKLTDEANKLLALEKPKKWIWGGVGIGVALLVALL